MKTVRELIEALQKVNPDAPVATTCNFLYAWDGTVETLESGTVRLGIAEALRDDGAPMH